MPIGKVGIYLRALFLHINMYTMAGIFCIFLGILNLAVVWMYGRTEYSVDELDSDNNDECKDMRILYLCVIQ